MIEVCAKPVEQPIPFGVDLFTQLRASLVPFLFPLCETIFVLGP